MSMSNQVSPPEKFNFGSPEEWPKWSWRFERFLNASGLKEKDDEIQVHSLVYCMGDEADDLLSSFNLSDEDRKSMIQYLASLKLILCDVRM